MAVGVREEELGGGSEYRAVPKVGGVHYLAKCVVRGSAVLHAVYAHLRSPSSHDIVFGKETSLELVVIGDDGIVQSICEQAVYGIVKDLAILRWNEKFREPTLETQGKDLLVVLSDSGKLSFLTFCCKMHRFFAITHIELSEPGNSLQQLGRMLAVDSKGTYVAVSAFEDRFALFPVSKYAQSNIVGEKVSYPPENKGEAFGTNIRGTIWSMCFISDGRNYYSKEEYSPILAVIMHRKGAVLNELLLFVCNLKTSTIHVITQYSEPGPLALSISAVPNLVGFAFLFRMGDVLLLDLTDPHAISCIQRINFTLPGVIEEKHSVEESYRGADVDDEGMFNVAACALLELRDSGTDMIKDDSPMNIDGGCDKIVSSSNLVCSWSWEPGESASTKLIFCLDTGELFIIEVHSDVEGIRISLSDCLYRCLPCKALLWVEGGLIAGLVEMGDGLVLKLEHERLIYKSPIQNIAPILDLSVVDYHDEKQDQMFACSGMGPEGSLRVIRSGISVERLLRTVPNYRGITGTWTLRMRKDDPYHSFLVLSFVEETRILSVGLSFIDISDAVGFHTGASTLACGLVSDGLLVQIHKSGVRLCSPTKSAHHEGASFSTPICHSWFPANMAISLGAVGCNLIIVATSNPCFLFILGVRWLSGYEYEIYEIQHIRLEHEVSCISIPQGSVNHEQLASKVGMPKFREAVIPGIVDIDKIFVIGTHKPSVEILSLVPDVGWKVHATATISIMDALGNPVTGCIPEDVRLVSVDRSYVISGLRNGMLLRFEWPAISAVPQAEQSRESQFTATCANRMDCSSSSATVPGSFGNVIAMAESTIPVILQLIAVRRIGITPVCLVPLHDSLDSDLLILSERPWLLHSARHSLAYTSISFQPATHVTPVCSIDCPMGIVFVADNALHLVELVHNKRLNVQKFSIEGTPRKALYHNESKTVLVMRIGLRGFSYSSDICRIDLLSGALLSKFKCEPGETAKCMQIVKGGYEHMLVVGTSRCAGRTIMPSGEAQSEKGRLIVLGLGSYKFSSDSRLIYRYESSSQIASPFREIIGYSSEQLSSNSDDTSCDAFELEDIEACRYVSCQLRVISHSMLPAGAVLTVCPYLNRYVLASSGNNLNVFSFPNEPSQRLRRLAVAKTRFAITCLTTHFTRIVVGDCRDGILFFSYDENRKELEQLYSDPLQRLVADCALIDLDTAVVSDRRGSVSILSCTNHSEGNESPEKNLLVNCSFYMGETVMSIQKGLFSYKLPVDVLRKSYGGSEVALEPAYSSIIASTLLGSVLIFVPITSEEHELLEAVQARLVVHPLTSPILGNDHKEFRARGSQGEATILDGDMLSQFLELTSKQQEAVLESPNTPLDTMASTSSSQPSPLSVSQVVRLLERVYYVLN